MDPTKACKANCELFDKYASYFESQVVPLWGEVYDTLVTRARISPGHRVLDIGTGTGEIALRAGRLVGPSGSVLGVDSADSMLEIARTKAAASTIKNVEFNESTAEKLELPESSFDVVLGNYSLCCFMDYEAALSECLRVLKPQGRLTYNHGGPSDPPEFAAAFNAFDEYKTKSPSKALAEFREADTLQKQAVEKYREPSVTLEALRRLGYAEAEVAVVRRVIKYPNSDAFLDRLLAFNWRNEADELSLATIEKFRSEAKTALEQLARGPGLRVEDDTLYFTGLKPQPD